MTRGFAGAQKLYYVLQSDGRTEAEEKLGTFVCREASKSHADQDDGREVTGFDTGPPSGSLAPSLLHDVERVSELGCVGSQVGMSVEQRRRSDKYWSAAHSQMIATCKSGHEWREGSTIYAIRRFGVRAGTITRVCRICNEIHKAHLKAQQV